MTNLNNNSDKDTVNDTFRYNRGSRLPISITKGVDVSYDNRQIKIKGIKGESTLDVNNSVNVSLDNDAKTISLVPSTADDLAIAGTMVALFKSKMKGVSEGHQKTLEIVGVGYKINPLPAGSSLNSFADKVFLIYSRETKSYYLRTFEINNINIRASSASINIQMLNSLKKF